MRRGKKSRESVSEKWNLDYVGEGDEGVQDTYIVTDRVRAFHSRTYEHADFMCEALRLYTRYVEVGGGEVAFAPSKWRIDHGSDDGVHPALSGTWQLTDGKKVLHAWSAEDAKWLLDALTWHEAYVVIRGRRTVDLGLSVVSQNVLEASVAQLAGKNPLLQAAALRMFYEVLDAIARRDIPDITTLAGKSGPVVTAEAMVWQVSLDGGKSWCECSKENADIAVGKGFMSRALRVVDVVQPSGKY